MDAGNTAVKIVGAVEHRRVGVGHLRVVGEPVPVVERAGRGLVVDGAQHGDRFLRPHSPLSEKPADDTQPRRIRLLPAKTELGEQVCDDVVVIARVERDLSAPA